MLLTVPVTPQTSGMSTARSAVGGKNRSNGAIKSFSSEVNDVDERVFTITLLKGIPQGVFPNRLEGFNPSAVRFTPNSINWPGSNCVTIVPLARGNLKGPAQVGSAF